MPVYEYKCKQCKRSADSFRTIENRNKSGWCAFCGSRTKRVMVTMFGADTFDEITLEHINVEGEGPLTFTTKKDLSAYCKKHGLVCGALKQI